MKKKLIQLIHVGQKQLKMEDDAYRLMLKRLTGKESSLKCTIPELHKVIHELQQKGADISSGLFFKKYQEPKSNITKKIYVLWDELGKADALKDPSRQALNAFMRKIICKNSKIIYFSVECLDDQEATKLLEILKKWHARLVKVKS